MRVEVAVPERLKEHFTQEVLGMYLRGEISATRAASMLGIPLAQFYELLAKRGIPLPEALNKSLLKELDEIANEIGQE